MPQPIKKTWPQLNETAQEDMARFERERERLIDMLTSLPIISSSAETGTILNGDDLINLLLPSLHFDPVVKRGCDRCAQFPDFEETLTSSFLKMTLGCKCFKRCEVVAIENFVYSSVSGDYLRHEQKVKLYEEWNKWAESRYGIEHL